MNIFRDTSLLNFARGCVATIGNFDGVHQGHQALLRQVKHLAAQRQLPAIMVIFEPQAAEFFSPQPPARVSNLREKCSYLQQYGGENILILSFTAKLASQSAEDFVTTLLCQRLNIKHLIVGDDFRFGHRRQGNFALLQHMGQKLGFTVYADSTQADDKGRISSTRIRQALADANFTAAQQLLGHSFCMMGRVVHGQKLGRELGFPTLNIAVKRRQVPVQGIFAVKVHGIDGQIYLGAASLGVRPAVGGKQMLLEVHVLDFNQQIYGKLVQIEFCHKIRDEEDYANLDLLQAQIARDVQQIREYFNDRL